MELCRLLTTFVTMGLTDLYWRNATEPKLEALQAPIRENVAAHSSVNAVLVSCVACLLSWTGISTPFIVQRREKKKLLGKKFQ